MISRIFSKPNYFIRSAKVVISEPQTIEPGSSSLASTSSSQDDTPTIRVDLPKNSNEKKKPDDKKPVQEIKSCATDELKKEEIPAERDEFTKAADAGVLPTTVKPVEVDKPAYSGWLGGVFSSLDVSTMYTGFTSYVASGVNSWLPEKKQESVKVMAPKLSRAEVIARTQNLVTLLLAAESNDSIMERTTGLSNHLMEFPASRSAAIQRNPHLIPFLLKKMKLADDPLIKHESRKCLALLGYMMPLKSDGIRVLSLDGGGTRGMMTLEILEALEKAAGGKKICELFDYICGVSTGGIIAVYLAAKQLSIEETRERYIHISNRVFNKSSYTTFGLVMKHSMYNTETWINILKEELGDDMMIETARFEGTPKLGIPSCIVNVRNLQSYVFRNYEHPPGMTSHYRGGTNYRLWQIIQATTAAPMYFQKVPLGNIEHQDGGVLTNNPTAIALHEAKLLWPKEKLQCVVSIGNGRTVEEPELIQFSKYSSGLRSRETWLQLERIIDAATDTEKVHYAMLDSLPADVYFRLNPYMSHTYTLDETDSKKLAQMQEDAKQYVRKNKNKIHSAANQLVKEPVLHKHLMRNLVSWNHEKQLFGSGYNI